MNKIFKRKKLKKFKGKINKQNKLSIKNKNQTKKSGDSKKYFINQIRIKNNYLIHFPFYKIKNEEEFKVKILDSLISRGEFFEINEQIELNNKFFNKKNIEKFNYILKYKNIVDTEIKSFEIRIEGRDILYLIEYYYYTILEYIIKINKYHYSHKNINDIMIIVEKMSCLIENCNKITEKLKKILQN